MLQDLFDLHVAAEHAHDPVLCVGHCAGNRDDELAGKARGVDIHDVQIASLHGLLEPLAVREVEAWGKILVEGAIGLVRGQGHAFENALIVRKRDKLDEGMLGRELFQKPCGLVVEVEQALFLGEVADNMGRELACELLHAIVFRDGEFGHVA